MKQSIILLFALVSLLSAQNLPAIAVMELQGRGISADNLAGLTNRLRTELFKTGAYRVIERAQMDMVLKEQGFQQAGCISSECAVEVGQLIGAEKIVVGDIDLVDSIYVTDIRLVDVRTGAIEKSATADCDGCTLGDLLRNTLFTTAQILAGKIENGIGTAIPMLSSNPAVINSNETGALEIHTGKRNRVTVNGDSVGMGDQFLATLEPAKYTVTIDKPYKTYSVTQDVFVRPAQTRYVRFIDIVPFVELSYVQSALKTEGHGSEDFTIIPKGVSGQAGTIFGKHLVSIIRDYAFVPPHTIEGVHEWSLDSSFYSRTDKVFSTHRYKGIGIRYEFSPVHFRHFEFGVGAVTGVWEYNSTAKYYYYNIYPLDSSHNQSGVVTDGYGTFVIKNYATFRGYGGPSVTLRSGFKSIWLTLNYRALFGAKEKQINANNITQHFMLGMQVRLRKFSDPKGSTHE